MQLTDVLSDHGIGTALSNIKNMQSGQITFNNTNTTSWVYDSASNRYYYDLTVSTIGNNAVATVQTFTANGNLQMSSMTILAEIATATKLRFWVYSYPSDYPVTVRWAIVEYNNVKSLQIAESVTSSSDTMNISINSVNTNKTLVFCTWNSSSGVSGTYANQVLSYLSNSTTYTFKCRWQEYETIRVRFYIVEFN